MEGHLILHLQFLFSKIFLIDEKNQVLTEKNLFSTIRRIFGGGGVKLSGKHSNFSTAATEFRVLSTNGSAAMVECLMVSGVKHQIRVHLGLGLGTPILGDSKVRRKIIC